MLDFLRTYFRNHAVLAITVLALVTLGLFSTIAVLFPSSREIFYEMHPVFTMCMPSTNKSGTATCVARMELNIGNTGDTEESVTLVWPHFEGGWSSGHNVLNISADRRRSHDPVVDCEVKDGKQECVFDRFSAGALIVMHMDCYQCNSQEIGLLRETPLEVSTDAHAVYGDPRVTLLLRRLMALAQLF